MALAILSSAEGDRLRSSGRSPYQRSSLIHGVNKRLYFMSYPAGSPAGSLPRAAPVGRYVTYTRRIYKSFQCRSQLGSLPINESLSGRQHEYPELHLSRPIALYVTFARRYSTFRIYYRRRATLGHWFGLIISVAFLDRRTFLPAGSYYLTGIGIPSISLDTSWAPIGIIVSNLL